MSEMQNPFGITRDEIIELAAQKIADNFADSENIETLARTLIESRVKTLFETKVSATVDSFLQGEMEKILTSEICPVDIYGEKCGKPTTIKQILAERARVFWETKVDDNGGETRGSWGGKPRHEHLFAKIVNEEFTKAVKQNIVNLVGAFKDALSESANKITKEHIDSLIKVKTQNG